MSVCLPDCLSVCFYMQYGGCEYLHTGSQGIGNLSVQKKDKSNQKKWSLKICIGSSCRYESQKEISKFVIQSKDLTSTPINPNNSRGLGSSLPCSNERVNQKIN